MRKKTYRVLVVEDSETGSLLLQSLLEDEGIFEITLARTGNEAVKLIERVYDIVLLDIMVPEVDGYTILKMLKAKPLTANIPVIIISAKNSEKDIRHATELGAKDFIIKPYTMHNVLSVIYSTLHIEPPQSTFRQ